MGSFFNVVIFRLPKEKSIIKPRSYCPACKHNIPWYYNIPVISYFQLKGKCKFCKAKIPPRYPVVEALTGLVFYFVFVEYGLSLELVFSLIFSSIFIILFFTDIETRILPDELTIGGSILAIIYSFLRNDLSYKQSLLGALIGFVIFVGSYFFFLKIKNQEALGGGDIKYIILIGALFGPLSMLLIIILSSFMGILTWGVLILFFKKGKNYELPYGSFLSLTAFLFMFYGEHLLIIYDRFFPIIK